MRVFACMTLSFLAACAAFPQTPASSPKDSEPRFEVTDVHPTTITGVGNVRGPFTTGARYDLRGANIVDLIVKAYGVTADKVLDGPNWIEYDRFDIVGLMPPKTTPDAAKLMLQSLLKDRFQLGIRREERPLPAYVLTAPKGKQKIKESDGSGDTGCRTRLDQDRLPDGTAGGIIATYTCKNMTLATFAESMSTMLLAQQIIGTNPVQDKTGIEGKWDFTFKYNLPVGATGDNISLADALDKQVGLKLEQVTVSLPVIVVDKVNKPSPNIPDVAKKFPPIPTEFEVATIKPFVTPAPGTPVMMGIRAQPGGRVEMNGMALKQLVQNAWSVQADSIIGAPKFMENDRYSIMGKMPDSGAAPGPNSNLDADTLFAMIRGLLIERFNIKAHFEDRPATAYTLTAAKPKLKKADPASRTKWTDSNGPGIISVAGGSIPSRTIKFQNMSMAQLAEKLQFLAGSYFHAPILDATGLEGGYDFTLTFSAIAPAQLATLINRPPDAAAGGNAADPIGGVTIFEAVEKQLGLKLVEQKRPVQMLVIDHIDEKPTDN